MEKASQTYPLRSPSFDLRVSPGHLMEKSNLEVVVERWVGTRVRESQMTCVCVRVTTSSEVVHRRHRDEKERKGSKEKK